MDRFKLYNVLFVDKHIVILFCLAAAITVHTTHSSLFNLFQINTHDVELAMAFIADNSELFSNSPMQSTGGDSNVVITGAGIMVTSTDIMRVYTLLSFHPSWLLNSALTNIISAGQFHMMMIGAIIATFLYKPDTKKFTVSNYKSHFTILRNELVTAILVSVVFILVVSVIGVAIGYIEYLRVRHTDEMMLISDLYDVGEIWMPGVLYYVRAVFGSFLHLISHVLLGMVVGHLLRDRVLSIIIMLLVSMHLFAYMFLYPIAPSFFLARLSGSFIYSISRLPTLAGGNTTVVFLSFVIYLLALVAICFVMIRFDMKKRLSVPGVQSSGAESKL